MKTNAYGNAAIEIMNAHGVDHVNVTHRELLDEIYIKSGNTTWNLESAYSKQQAHNYVLNGLGRDDRFVRIGLQSTIVPMVSREEV